MTGSRGGSAATLLVQIANDLFTFGCVSEQRGRTSRVSGDDPVAVYVFAMPKSQSGRPASSA